MKKLIVANWKMNPSTLKEAKELFGSVKKRIRSIKDVTIVICPPFVYLPLLKGLTLGAQNAFGEEKGAFTGAISAWQLRDLSIEYVIVGHSERRKYFGETNQVINQQLKKVLEAGLRPIFCVGEQEGENKETVLRNQIVEGLEGITPEAVKEIVFAYEPVWAIGTGKNCSVEETLDAIALVRKVVMGLYNDTIAQAAPVLYGGSVNGRNAADYIKENEIAGFLVGGASLDPDEFVSIIRAVK